MPSTTIHLFTNRLKRLGKLANTLPLKPTKENIKHGMIQRPIMVIVDGNLNKKKFTQVCISILTYIEKGEMETSLVIYEPKGAIPKGSVMVKDLVSLQALVSQQGEDEG